MRRILREFRPHRKLATIGAAAAIVGTIIQSAAPLVIGLGIDRGVIQRDGQMLLIAFAAMLVIVVGQALLAYIETKTMGRFAQEYMATLRRKLLDHLFFLDLDFFGRERSGRLISRLTSDVDNLQQFVGAGLSLLIQSLFLLIFTIALMATQSMRMTLAVLVILPPLLAATIWFQKQAFIAQVDVRDRVGALLTRLNESLSGIRVVKAYNVEDEQLRAFDEVNQDTYHAKMGVAKVVAKYYPLVEFLHPVSLLIVLGYGAYLRSKGEISVGVVAAFVLYTSKLFQPIQQFTELSHVVQAASASFAKVFGFQDERPRVVDAPDAKPLKRGPGTIEMHGVSFRYSDDSPEVVHDVGLTIPAGQRIALVGGSGAGKSTVAKLIARFYDPSRGRILVDNQDLRDVTGDSYRRQVSLISQEGFLFDGTIADNIAAARPGAKRKAVEEAWGSLGIQELLTTLPKGLDTDVSNQGLSLSSGQRQLVALARAFLAQPRILIMDEATSNLDPATEAVVEYALGRLLEGRTAIVIAHRPRTALRADRVIMLEKGRIVEDGSPAELQDQGGPFSKWVAAAMASDPLFQTLIAQSI